MRDPLCSVGSDLRKSTLVLNEEMWTDDPAAGRNAIRKVLWELIDRPPIDQEKLLVWTFFNSSCAYCGRVLERGARTGSLDHLVPRARGGSNQLANIVLACLSCNGDERRDELWSQFLRRRCGRSAEEASRRALIERWIGLNGGEEMQHDEELAALCEPYRIAAVEAFNSACAAIRRVRDQARRG